MASHPLEVADGVADGVNPYVTHMQTAWWVGEHGEHVELLPGALSKKKIQSFYIEFLKTLLAWYNYYSENPN